MNKYPLTLTKNLTFLTFLTKSNQIQQPINKEVEKRVHNTVKLHTVCSQIKMNFFAQNLREVSANLVKNFDTVFF